MKKLFVILLLSSLILSCNDPVFYSISMEEEPLDPRIAGTSTNFVSIGDKMFVASRNRIYCYNSEGYGTADYKKGKWSRFSISGRIMRLAATTTNLYALSDNEIKEIDPDTKAVTGKISISGKTIEGIYAVDDNYIFIGTSDNGIYYYDFTSTSTSKISAPSGNSFSMLIGVASDDDYYYLCNKDGNGIFSVDKSALTPVILISKSKDINFTGIINLEDTASTIVAISRGGRLYNVKNSMKIVDSIGSREATSAIYVWNDGTNKLLLVGRQDLTNSISTGYTHGYVEILIDETSGIASGSSFYEPGGGTRISSMANNTNEHYKTSIGKRGINYFHQASDKILFASTNHGVWAYRNHRNKSKKTWNAEE